MQYSAVTQYHYSLSIIVVEIFKECYVHLGINQSKCFIVNDYFLIHQRKLKYRIFSNHNYIVCILNIAGGLYILSIPLTSFATVIIRVDMLQPTSSLSCICVYCVEYMQLRFYMLVVALHLRAKSSSKINCTRYLRERIVIAHIISVLSNGNKYKIYNIVINNNNSTKCAVFQLTFSFRLVPTCAVATPTTQRGVGAIGMILHGFHTQLSTAPLPTLVPLPVSPTSAELDLLYLNQTCWKLIGNHQQIGYTRQTVPSDTNSFQVQVQHPQVLRKGCAYL